MQPKLIKSSSSSSTVVVFGHSRRSKSQPSLLAWFELPSILAAEERGKMNTSLEGATKGKGLRGRSKGREGKGRPIERREGKEGGASRSLSATFLLVGTPARTHDVRSPPPPQSPPHFHSSNRAKQTDADADAAPLPLVVAARPRWNWRRAADLGPVLLAFFIILRLRAPSLPCLLLGCVAASAQKQTLDGWMQLQIALTILSRLLLLFSLPRSITPHSLGRPQFSALPRRAAA